MAGCSGRDDEPQLRLTITREDGSGVEISGGLRAWCGVPRSQGDAGRSLHVLEGDTTAAYWLFRSELVQLERAKSFGMRFAVPQVPVDTPSWVFFVNDVERDNEVATYTEESSGLIEVKEWGATKATP